ncbi:DUF6584 family protein [Niallia sp. NCCP-28]|uniref:DUF6584 family protein n=1 Tax=Niallia sp. NCCP-28 TaxID=2934712 RepID=UPI0020C121FE|nr:DUF6584 family protein [Niallia sp. NCCP-28]
MEKIPVKTLKKLKEDVQKNDLGKARDRLHGLISTYPNELQLRKRLGDIYFELKYPSMAGRYWYLEEKKTPEMVKACIQFEKKMGKDPEKIARALKYKGNMEILKRLKLDEEIFSLPNKVKEKLVEKPENSLDDKLVTFGCLSIIVLIIILILIGIYTVFKWIF